MDRCRTTRSKRRQFLGMSLLSAALLSVAPATVAADVIYVYDELGRLRSVIDAAGNSATYRYDAVGNLTEIARGSSGGLSVTSVAPAAGTYGTTVTISGTGFGGVAADTVLTFNGVPAAITSSTPTKLVARVPVGATTGPVTVTTPAGSARSGTVFTVTASDLTPTAFTAPGTAGTGQTITVSWTVANQGTAPTSGSWIDAVYLSTDAACCVGDTPMARVTAATVGPGRTYTKIQTMTVPRVPAGQYYLILKVDADRALAEADDGNNQRAIPIAVTVPDLAPTALTAPASATTGQAISIGWTVVNRGASAASPPWADGLFLAAEPTCCSAATPLASATRTIGLSAGATYSQRAVVTVPVVPAGNYYLILAVDHAGGTWEGDEANNRRTVPISIGTPDLASTALTAPPAVKAQETFTVSWTVTNRGAGVAAPPWKDAVYLSVHPVCCIVNAGDIALVTVGRTTSLAPGAGYAQTRTVTMPRVPAGNYFLFVDVDTGVAVYEADRANNRRVLPVTVTTPDLVATDLSAPAAARARQSVSVSWAVSNQGTGSAKPPWTDFVYLSTGQTCCAGATPLASASHTTALAPGGSYAQTRSVVIPVKPAGNYYLILRVDAANALFEADEANNQRVVPFTITP